MDLNELEIEFTKEMKGEGSLSPYAARNPTNYLRGFSEEEGFNIGYDIHLENLEALYFNGLKLPRWENIEGETVAERQAIYHESFAKCTSAYPLLSRVSDTDERVGYTAEEVLELRDECSRLLTDTSDSRAVLAIQKFIIACNKAAENQMGLLLVPTL
jgi:hypothetical protein